MNDPLVNRDELEKTGQRLVERGALAPDALAKELERARAGAGESEGEFLSALVAAGACSEGAVVAFLAERSGFPGVDLSKSAFLLSVLGVIPRPVAEQEQILPLSTEGARLHIAVRDPAAGKESIDEVRFITGMDISLYIALAGPLGRCIPAAFDARARGETVWRGAAVAPDASPLLASIQPSQLGPEAHAAAERAAAASSAAPDAAAAPDPKARDTAPPVSAAPEPVAAPAPAAAPDAAPAPEQPAAAAAPAPEDEIIEGELLEAEVVEEIPATPIDSQPKLPALGAQQKPAIEIEVGDDGGDEEEELVVSIRTGPKRIFVVDDEPDIIRLCSRALQLKGYLVESAADGALAEARLKKAPPPDLVLLDAMLPLVHGFEICQRIKSSKALRGVPVIMMSAVYRGWRVAQDAKETYGADDFIEKPFHVADLLRRVEERFAEGSSGPQAPKQSTEKLYRSGVELLAAGKAQEGRKALESAAREDPFSPRIQFALGGALAASGDTYRAITAYERAVELRPKLFPALKNLAALYLEKGFRQKALETLERAFAAAPDPKAREEIRLQLARLV